MTPLLHQHRREIELLCRKFRVRRLEVFGSAAADTFDPARSDIDLLVEFETLPEHDPWSYFRLREALIELLGRNVDLVEPGGIRNEHYRRSIDAQRKPIYAA